MVVCFREDIVLDESWHGRLAVWGRRKSRKSDRMVWYGISSVRVFESSAKNAKERPQPGIEPGTSCTRSRNHTARPLGLLLIFLLFTFIRSSKHSNKLPFSHTKQHYITLLYVFSHPMTHIDPQKQIRRKRTLSYWHTKKIIFIPTASTHCFYITRL